MMASVFVNLPVMSRLSPVTPNVRKNALSSTSRRCAKFRFQDLSQAIKQECVVNIKYLKMHRKEFCMENVGLELLRIW